MNKHQLDEIDINFQLNDDCFINKLIKENDTFYIIYYYYFNKNEQKTSFTDWVGKGTKKILNILKPEEIEEQRIRNEAKKFNF
jgi:hypothetical protein